MGKIVQNKLYCICTVYFKMFWWNWNEQSKSSINSLMRDMRQPIFMKIKIIPLALLEIAASMHSPFCPIWRIFLPVYHRPSKRANGMILIFMKMCCLLSPFNEFYIRLLFSFQFLQSILKYTVLARVARLRKAHSESISTLLCSSNLS